MTFDDQFYEMLRYHFQEAPFNKLLGLEVHPLGEGYARVDAPYKPELIGDSIRPSLHGGLLATLIDTAGGLAVWTKAGPSARLSTIDLRVDYLRAATTDRVVCEAKVVRVGKVGVAEMKTFHPDKPNQTLAIGIGVYNIAHLKP